MTSYFHWDNPVGRGWSDSWSPSFNDVYEPEDKWMSVDEYAAHVTDFNAAPLLGVNARSGWRYGMHQEGLDNATALAEHVSSSNGSFWPASGVKYWFIDNEQHLEKYMDTPWTEEQYAYYINEYANAIRTVIPEAKFVANWKNGAPSSWDTLLGAAGTNIGMMDIHSYWHKNGWATTTWDSYLSGANDVIKWQGMTYRDYVEGFRNRAFSYGLNDMEVAILEWGVSPSPADEALSRFQTAFVVSDIFMQMIDSNLDHACYWPLRVPAGSDDSHRALVDHNNEPTVVRLFLQFFKEIKNYRLIRVALNSREHATHSIAAVSKSGAKMVVYILRKASGSAYRFAFRTPRDSLPRPPRPFRTRHRAEIQALRPRYGPARQLTLVATELA